MNTHTTAHKAKIRHLCSCLVLCLHLASGAIPAPCEHSVTEEHLQTLQKLILNQVQSGCSINYWFTERQNLSEVCYVKAAFPYILDLLNTHFTYETGSDNDRYSSALKDLIYNIYLENCIPPNDEIEGNSLTFVRLHTSLPKESLQKTKEVFQMYKRLMSNNDKPVSWNCEDEYANYFPESTTASHSQTTGTPERQCSCPHNLKTIMVSRSTPTALPASPYTQSGAHIFRNKNDRSKASVKPKAPKPTPNQISVISPGPDPFTELFTEEQSAPIPVDSANFITTITSDVMDYSTDTSVVMGSEPHSITSSPIASSSKLPGIPTRSLVTPQPYEKTKTHFISDRNLAKRSLDSRKQGILTDFFSKLFQSWISESMGTSRNEKVKLLERETPPVEQIRPGHLQRHSYIIKSSPGNVFKIISRESDCKDSRCPKSTDQQSRDRVKRHSVKKEYQLAGIHMSMYTTFLMTSACPLLLFITLLCYCKQQRIRDLQRGDGTIHL